MTTRTASHLLPGSTVLALLLGASASAATIDVDTTADLLDTAGDCSLREAVIAANTNTAVDGCAAGELGQDTLNLPAGEYVLSLVGTDESWEAVGGEAADPFAAVDLPDPTIGDLDILESVALVGAGVDATVIRWGEGDVDRIFQVAPPAETTVDVSMTGLTLSDGSVGSEIVNGSAPEEEQWIFRRFGGAVAIGAGSGVKLMGSSGPSDDGGPSDEEEGIFGSASLVLTDVAILHCYAGGDAGGLFSTGPLDMERVWFEGNITAGNGGALYQEADFTWTDIAFVDNEAEGGGAVFMTGPTSGAMHRVLFDGNYATGGGGLSLRSLVDIDVHEAMVVGNEAFDVGGGFYSNGTMRIHGATFADNVAGSDADFGGGALNSFGGGSFAVVNTVFTGNVAGAVPANCGCTGGTCDPADYVESLGHNLEDADTCGFDQDGDVVDTDPLLTAYGDYGGAFATMLPTPDSPLLDAGDTALCGDADARGVERPQDGDRDAAADCDIGAAELSPQEYDWDGDGYCEGLQLDADPFCTDGSTPGDCDDTEALTNPEGLEICNDGVDDDCDGLADDLDEDVDLTTGSEWYLDSDQDGYGDPETTMVACAQPDGYVDDATDCDDADGAVNPGVDEIFDNEIDDDCDGFADKDDPDYDAGCSGCAATGAPGAAAWLGLLGLLGLAGRRRRD